MCSQCVPGVSNAFVAQQYVIIIIIIIIIIELQTIVMDLTGFRHLMVSILIITNVRADSGDSQSHEEVVCFVRAQSQRATNDSVLRRC
jgi:flagellar biosynthesis component FlhA